jgi:predicted dehydrogenase
VLLNPAFAQGDSAWHVDPIANVGMFFDDAAHAADWFYWMLGAPLSVMAEIDNIVTDVAPDDNGLAIYRSAGGVIGVLLNSSTTVAAIGTTEIYGDQGTILQDYGDSPATSAPRSAVATPTVCHRRCLRGALQWCRLSRLLCRSRGGGCGGECG